MTFRTTSIDASEMLAEALKQMDGLLANHLQDDDDEEFNKNLYDFGIISEPPSEPKTKPQSVPNTPIKHSSHDGVSIAPRMQQAKTIRLLEELYQTVVTVHDVQFVKQRVSMDLLNFILNWLNFAVKGYSDEFKPEDKHRLDLLAEISSLKLKLASVERDNKQMEDKYTASQKRIDDLQSQLNDKNVELTLLRNKLSHGYDNLSRNYTASLSRSDSRGDPMKRMVEMLSVSNEEKDRHIDDLTRMITRYQQMEDIMASQGRRVFDPLDYFTDTLSDSSSNCNSAASSSGGTNDISADHLAIWQKMTSSTSSSVKSSPLYHPAATSTPMGNPVYDNKMVNNFTPPSTILQQSPDYDEVPGPDYDMVPGDEDDDGEDLVDIQKFSKPINNANNGLPPVPAHTVIRQNSKHQTQSNNTSEDDTLKEQMAQEYNKLRKQNLEENPKTRRKGTFRTLIGKLKRSNSQEFADGGDEFKRGVATRATASARLGSSSSRKEKLQLDGTPLAQWDKEKVASWLESIGLQMYATACKKAFTKGDQLLKATTQDLEKEIGLKNPLHRKKLHLALVSLSQKNKIDSRDQLDTTWVLQWLEDIGLPQYKESFMEGAVDGRMLYALTSEDLLHLKVTLALHHASFKAAIHVLRLMRFNPRCLKRKALTDEGSVTNPVDVMLWSNQRVGEWLRTIDLSEYATNVRSTGIHGGLFILEPRFNAELLATLLSIPQSKTLLRRHLTTHFVSIIGSATLHKKREVEANPHYQPFGPTQKIRSKKSLFSSIQRDNEEDYLCPVHVQMPNFDEVVKSDILTRKDYSKKGKKFDKVWEDDELPTSTV